MRQYGKALGILNKSLIDENFLHADVDAFDAPSECHDLVSKGEAKRLRKARRHAHSIVRMPIRVFMKRLNKEFGPWVINRATNQQEVRFWKGLYSK